MPNFFIEKLDLQTSNNILNLSNLTFCNISILSNIINSNVNDINTINERIGNDRILQQLDPFTGYEIVEFQQSTGIINRIDENQYDIGTLQIQVGSENVDPSTGIFNRLELIENIINIELDERIGRPESLIPINLLPSGVYIPIKEIQLELASSIQQVTANSGLIATLQGQVFALTGSGSIITLITGGVVGSISSTASDASLKP